MADLKVGDRVRRHIEYGIEGGSRLPAETGKVVYIHPEGRFYTVEFTFPTRDGKTRKFRESYLMNKPKNNKTGGYEHDLP